MAQGSQLGASAAAAARPGADTPEDSGSARVPPHPTDLQKSSPWARMSHSAALAQPQAWPSSHLTMAARLCSFVGCVTDLSFVTQFNAAVPVMHTSLARPPMPTVPSGGTAAGLPTQAST